jgi:hypothetical protein
MIEDDFDTDGIKFTVVWEVYVGLTEEWLALLEEWDNE